MDGAAVGIDDDLAGFFGNGSQKPIVQHRDLLGFIVEIVTGVIVGTKIIAVIPVCRCIRSLRLREPDVFPDFFRSHILVEVFADQQRFPQIVKAETAAGALYCFLALAVAINDPFDLQR